MPLDPHLVTAGDGTTFSCVVDRGGALDGSDVWIFTDVASGERYVGPPATPITNEIDLHAIVVNWWAMERALRIRDAMHAETDARIEATRRRISHL